jgi:ERF superfamily
MIEIETIPEIKTGWGWQTQLEYLKAIQELVRSEAKAINEAIPEDPYESAQTNEINSARAKAAAEYPRIGNNCENPYFKSSYADLDGIMYQIRPILAKHGLTVEFKTVISQDGSTVLKTRILHTSGQWSESRARIIPTKNDQQAYASALTYMKRHQAMALLNITISDDWSDDDAERNMAEVRNVSNKGTAINTKYNPKEQSGVTITKEQLEELEYELSEFPDICTQVLEGLKIESLADMPKNKFQVSILRIREIKNARLGVK